MPSATQPPASLLAVFFAFMWIALQGFGGALAVAQRELCERRRWLTREEFVALLATAQVLPGPNMGNLAVLVGDHFFGLRGTAAALTGLFLLPLVIVLTLAIGYVRHAQLPEVAAALDGMAAVSAGLVAGTALKLAAALRASPLGPRACALLAAATFAAIAWLRLPLLWVLLALGGAGCLWAWRRLRAGPPAGAGDAGPSSAADAE